MVGSSAATSDTFKGRTPSNQDIVITRLFDAPRRLVFEAMTRPEHVKRWWGQLGPGLFRPICEIDLRVGRQVALREPPSPRGSRLPGRIPEDHPHSRLVHPETMEPHPEPGSVVTAVFTEENGKTQRVLGRGDLSHARDPGHRPRKRHGEGRGHQLRPSGGPGGRVATVIAFNQTRPHGPDSGRGLARAYSLRPPRRRS